MSEHPGKSAMSDISFWLDYFARGAWSAAEGGELDMKPRYGTSGKIMVMDDFNCDIHPIADCSCNHTCRTDANCELIAGHIVRCSPEKMRAIASYVSDLEARLEMASKTIEPFALVAEHDIGDYERDGDMFTPTPENVARAPKITIGDIRAARAWMEQNDE